MGRHRKKKKGGEVTTAAAPTTTITSASNRKGWWEDLGSDSEEGMWDDSEPIFYVAGEKRDPLFTVKKKDPPPPAKEWDPLKADAHSTRNTLESSLTPLFEALPSLSGLPCPFQKEKNTLCFKGPGCPYTHGRVYNKKWHPSRQLSTEREREVLLAAQVLPPQVRLPDGFTMRAWITDAYDPANIHVIFQSNICLCHKVEVEEQLTELERGACPGSALGKDVIRRKRMMGEKVNYGVGPDPPEISATGTQFGILAYDRLYTAMQKYYSENSVPQQAYYYNGELVAVKLPLAKNELEKQERSGWFRGVVLKTLNPEQEDDRLSPVRLKLLEFGQIVRVRGKNNEVVVPLHRMFADVPALAYKCILHGISPFLGEWKGDALNFFRTMARSQCAMVTVEKSRWYDGTSDFKMYDKTPMAVSLRFKGDGKLDNITKIMVDKGLGIPWNPFPTGNQEATKKVSPEQAKLIAKRQEQAFYFLSGRRKPYYHWQWEGQNEDMCTCSYSCTLCTFSMKETASVSNPYL